MELRSYLFLAFFGRSQKYINGGGEKGQQNADVEEYTVALEELARAKKLTSGLLDTADR